MIKVNAMGDVCPIPVIKTKNAIKEMAEGGVVEVLVDNEIAVQNLTKMAKQKQYDCRSEKIAENEYKVTITVPGTAATAGTVSGADASAGEGTVPGAEASASVGTVTGTDAVAAAEPAAVSKAEEAISCMPDSRRKKKLVVLRSGKMGEGSDELGTALMKSFIYALTELEELPETILLYNGGAYLSCEGSDSLEDLKSLEAQGVEIMTCGTCLNYYGIADRLAVGSVTNMYAIAEKMAEADTIICP
ncbi:MAG: sulfurtransferase-like selenium metabolism protein YedF [Clostridiales bacterium]|nr:sulfurtransferase-like selenium metabolism protein YedF [Clostridiales bacterium]